MPARTIRRQAVRHRHFAIEVKGRSSYPDSLSGEPRRGSAEFLCHQDEDDAAVRRALHKALDAVLDKVLPATPAPLAEWAVWRTPNEGTGYTWAHQVKKRTEGRVTLVCGLPVKPADGIFGREPHSALRSNWGACPSCVVGMPWTDPSDKAKLPFRLTGRGR